MKRLILAVLICVAMVSMAYGQELKDITSAAKEKATGIAKEQAAAIVDDTTITTEVKVKLKKTKALKGAEIDVSTTDGVVTLTGTVNSKSAKATAAKIAKAVKGVKSVENELTIVKPVKKTKKTQEKK